MQRWNCSQIEKEEEESWQEGDQMAGQWEEEQHLEELVEIGRLDGSFLKLEVMRKVPVLVVNDRMSRGKRVKKPQRKEECASVVC